MAAGYGEAMVVLGIDLTVEPGAIVALLGRNGAGKTTTLLAVSGLLKHAAGDVLLSGDKVSSSAARRVKDHGLAFVTEERSVLMGLTVRENLRLGRGTIDAALGWFPELEPHLARKAGLLSGGQQQMLTLARALASEPRLLLVDELSLGLAPVVVQRLFVALEQARDAGVAILIVEQHVRSALELADYAYVLDRGSIAMQGSGASMRARLPEIESSYLAGPRDVG